MISPNRAGQRFLREMVSDCLASLSFPRISPNNDERYWPSTRHLVAAVLLDIR
jgi:hypothetical protein